jgi:hypothetical protein
MLFQGNVYCQNSIPAEHLSHTKEIILLNTDRKLYLSGDEIWIAIKCVNAYSHKVSVLSKIAYVELYNNKKSAVLKKMIMLSEGRGSGVIQIPPGLETGYYTLRAYTNWMKNFSGSHYTNSIISIVNPWAKSLDYTDNPLDFRFYPEGGTLVPGIPNRICYSIISQNEIKSCNVLDNEDNLITAFTMNNIDIGSFTFIPEEKEYKIIITDELDSIYCFLLPAIQNDQSHLSISQGPSFMEISVIRPKPSISALLEIEKFDSVFYRLELNNSEQIQIIKLDKTQIPYGVSIVYLKDLSGNTQSARPVLNKGEDSNWLSCVTDKSQYYTREKVELTLGSKKMGSRVSLSINKKPHESSLHKIGLVPLIFSKKTHINSWYGSTIDYRTWEDYMIINTDCMISVHNGDKGKYISNPPEYNGHLIKGLLIPPMKETKYHHEVFLTIKGDPFGFYTSATSKDNMFYFPIRDLPINNELILCGTLDDSLKIKEVMIYDPFEESALEDSLPSLFITNELLSYLEQESLNNQLKIVFSINNKIEHRDSFLLKSRKNLPIPKDIYLLDKYTRFPVMEEVFREIIRNVYVRKNRGNYSLRVLDTENNELFNQNPLILLDGLPIFDVNKFMKINPLLIESIEVINSRSFIGESVFDGVIYVNSYERDYANYVIDHNYNKMNYYHIDDRITYFTPDYSNHEFKHSRIPDFRNLLFWNPDIRIDQGIFKKIEFYTSDDEGIYEIEISGINMDGSIISITSDFEVVKSN